MKEATTPDQKLVRLSEMQPRSGQSGYDTGYNDCLRHVHAIIKDEPIGLNIHRKHSLKQYLSEDEIIGEFVNYTEKVDAARAEFGLTSKQEQTVRDFLNGERTLEEYESLLDSGLDSLVKRMECSRSRLIRDYACEILDFLVRTPEDRIELARWEEGFKALKNGADPEAYNY